MTIRNYQPGDEAAQAEVFNVAAGPLPKFKAATADEVARRYRAVGFDPATRFYAVEGDAIVGYAGFDANGRVSYPWCRPGAEGVQGPLFDAVLSAMRRRGFPEAWAAYRADWEPVLRFLRDRGFVPAREMVNFVGEVARMPRDPVPAGHRIKPLGREDLPKLQSLGAGIIRDDAPELLEDFFWENPYFGPESLFGLRRDDGAVVGAALLIINPSYADPTKIDAAMPCFRLGALGTERERHKRVNGLFSCAFEDEGVATALLAEAARRLAEAGVTHVAAQAPSDRPGLCAFYDRHFGRQGSFPILSRRLRDA
jgi:GNAT superfamily N-acetyltransferase